MTPTHIYMTLDLEIRKRQTAAAALRTQAESNSYRRGAYKEPDRTCQWGEHVGKTKGDQDVILRRYVL